MNQAHAQAYEQNNTESQHCLQDSRVNVDFISDSRTEFSNKHIKGIGTVDRHEDGYVYGRLEQGTPFMCPEAHVQPIQYDHMKQMRIAFESWLKGQALFSILVYQYGPEVLIYDGIDGYKILAVALAFEVWKELDKSKQTNWTLQGLALAHTASSTQTRGGDHGQ